MKHELIGARVVYDSGDKEGVIVSAKAGPMMFDSGRMRATAKLEVKPDDGSANFYLPPSLVPAPGGEHE